jgi:hypothetical protein
MKTIFLFLFFILFSLSKVNAGSVTCDLEGCDKKYRNTEVTFAKAKNKDKPIIFFLVGGNATHTKLDPINKLAGKYDLLIMKSPYKVDTKVIQGYCELCNSEDQAQRIKSIILYYKNKYNKPIWLAGQSFGVQRAINYLVHSKENSKLISGVIFTGAAVGNPMRIVPIKLIKDLNIPVVILHHTKDICKYSTLAVAKEFYTEFSKINAGNTEFVEITAGRLREDDPYICNPSGKNHMFADSRTELAEEITNFIEKNSK